MIWWRRGADEWVEEQQKELQQAKAALYEAQAREPRVARVVGALKAHIEANNFGPTIERALGAPPR